MGPVWAQAFVGSGLVTLAGTPLLRRLAIAVDFVDHPRAAHKTHHRSTPYLGGVGLIAGVLVAVLLAGELTPEVVVMGLGGTFIGCLGLLDDHRSVTALTRFGVELGVAGLAVAAGLTIHATDIAVVDGLLTVVWITGVTNAVNLLDNMDGLAAGVSAAAATAIFALAVLSQQPLAMILTAGLAGACAGFLVHNKRPASIFMGDAGSLFLGFALAVLTIVVSPNLMPPTSFAVPVMLLALPVLDTATVTLCRLRRRRSVAQGGRDHLSHRLVALGLSPGVAVGVLVAVEAAAGGLAVAAGRRAVPLGVAVAAVTVLLAGLSLVTVRAPVYEEQVVGLPRAIRLAGAAVAGLLVVLAAPTLVALSRAHQSGVAGARAASAGLEAAAAGDAARAVTLLDGARRDLGRADRALHAPLTSLGLLVPGLRANLATARAVVEAGQIVAGSGLASVVAAAGVPLDPGADRIAAAQRLGPPLEHTASTLERAAASLAGYNRPYLLPSVASTVQRLRDQLTDAAGRAAGAAQVAGLVPALLGGAGARTYFLAIQDGAELRGSGGAVHQWGRLVADGGRVRLEHVGSVDELPARTAEGSELDLPQDLLARYRQFDPAGTWENATVSPDFEVSARALRALYARAGGGPVDGVVAVDLPGLAALLSLTGPVSVPGWPAPVDGTTLGALGRDEDPRLREAPARRAFLAGVTGAAVSALGSTDLGTPARLASTLGPAVHAGHLRLYSVRADEQALWQRLGAAGTFDRPAGDSVLIVNQNLTGAPIDPQLRRRVEYSVELMPRDDVTDVRAGMRVTLDNTATAGPVNRTYLSVYTPLLLANGSVEGRPVAMEDGVELGRRVYSTELAVPPGEERSLDVHLTGSLALGADGWYRLDVGRQPMAHADTVDISVLVPQGWRLVDARGLRIEGTRRASGALRTGSPEQVAVRLERTPWSRLWSVGGG